MLTTFRIFKTKHSGTWFDGGGAFRFGGRWNSRGTRLLYAAGSLSLATLEMLVNLNAEELLPSYSFATIEFDESLVLRAEDYRKLPKNWSDSPPPLALQNIGDDWARSMASAALKVPTSIVPNEHNYIINIKHPEFSRVRLGKPQPFVFDKRLYKNR